MLILNLSCPGEVSVWGHRNKKGLSNYQTQLLGSFLTENDGTIRKMESHHHSISITNSKAFSQICINR